MKLVSWNVNGIRSVLGKGFLDFVKQEKPDAICLQEVKAYPDQVGLKLPGYEQHWHSAAKKGYSGVAVFTKHKPLSVLRGIGHESDTEGRALTAEFPEFFLVNLYAPNSQHGLLRLDLKRAWNKQLMHYLKRLESKKPVVFCGDLNVAHKEIDIANPESNHESPGFTDEEREDFTDILGKGYIDTFRHFDSSPEKYTWWSYMANARARNIGWRLDYFCANEALKSTMKNAKILPDVWGSDHCPVVLEMDIKDVGGD